METLTKRERVGRSILLDNTRIEAGIDAPARVVELTRDTSGNAIFREKDTEEYRRARAAEHAERIANARRVLSVSRHGLSSLLGVSRRTVENWEQGRRIPSGAARLLLAVIEKHPEVVREVLA